MWKFSVEYLVLLLGLVWQLSVGSISDHTVSYEGEEQVWEGEPFKIVCKMSLRDPAGWTKDDKLLDTNDDVYVASDREVDTFHRELVLQVETAQLHHQGAYRCNRNSRDFHFLKVVAEGEEDDELEVDILSSAKYRNERLLEINKTIEFFCSSAKDEATPISWYKDSRRIVENPESNVDIIGQYLIIENANEDDAGQYMCTVDTPFATGFSDIGRIFHLNSPAKIADFPPWINIVAGRSLTLQCETHGYPLPRITWYIGNILASDRQKNDSRILIYSSDSGPQRDLLTVRDVSHSDRGLYTCRAENSVDLGLTTERDEESAFVHIRAISSIDFTASTTYVQKGGKFLLACRVPLSGVHLWYKDGKPIVPNSVNKFHLEQDQPSFSDDDSDYFMTMRLIVTEADSVHTGEYKCNSFGPYSQNVIVVTENMIETNEDEPGMGKILIPGHELVLQCNTSECPQCRVVWYKDNVPLSSIEDHLMIYDDNNSVVIDEATYEDSGVYTCAIDRSNLDVALNASIVVQSEIKLEKFDSSSAVVVQGSPLELHCIAKGAPPPSIKWFRGDEEIDESHERIKLLDHKGIKNAKLLIEEAEFEDRNHYTCEAYNQVNSVNTTVFIRIKDKLAALWPFLGICLEVAILCTIIFIYERRKRMSQCDEVDTDLPTENKNTRDRKAKGQDVRQRK